MAKIDGLAGSSALKRLVSGASFRAPGGACSFPGGLSAGSGARVAHTCKSRSGVVGERQAGRKMDGREWVGREVPVIGGHF